MPLKPGKSKKVIESNVKTEYASLKAKNPRMSKEKAAKQAYAIAMSHAGKSKKK